MKEKKIKEIKANISRINFLKFNEELYRIRANELLGDVQQSLHELSCLYNIESNIKIKNKKIEIEFLNFS
jgi:hypothetical protein